MPVVFSSTPGQVSRIVSKRPTQRMMIRTVSPVFNFLNSSCVVTGAKLNQRGNFQELQTLEDFAEMSSFGDRIAALQISGIAFMQTCGGNTYNGGGVGLAMDFYKNNRLSARASPIFLLFGARSLRGFLVDCDIELLNPEIGIAQFVFGLRVLPD